MKHYTIVILIFSTLLGYGQSEYSESILGAYFVAKVEGKLLNICENNQWYYSNCITANIETSDPTFEQDCLFNDIFGTYEYGGGDTLKMCNHKGEVLFLYQVVDTMNLKVIFAKNFLNPGDFLNRYSSFFPGHNCRSLFAVDMFARWTIFEIEDQQSNKRYEVLRFLKPGFIFKNKTYKIEQLPDSIFKEN